jgi:hypothetical protein
MRQTDDGVQHHELPFHRWQRQQRRRHRQHAHDLVIMGGCRRHRGRGRLLTRPLARAGAHRVQRQVARDRHNPGARPRPGPVGARVGVHPQEGLLQHVLGESPVGGDRQRHGEHRHAQLPVEPLQCGHVAGDDRLKGRLGVHRPSFTSTAAPTISRGLQRQNAAGPPLVG